MRDREIWGQLSRNIDRGHHSRSSYWDRAFRGVHQQNSKRLTRQKLKRIVSLVVSNAFEVIKRLTYTMEEGSEGARTTRKTAE